MTKITTSQLRPADIIVSTTDATVSGAIRTGSGSSVSHSMLYIGNQFVVEAISAGVVKRPLTQAIRDASLAIVVRRRSMTPIIRTAVTDQAERYVSLGLPYDKIGAAGAGTTHRRGRTLSTIGCILNPLLCSAAATAVARNASPAQADTAFFCSELIARVFELAGAPISNNSPSFTTPRHVRMSSALIYVGHLKDT
ncbi:MAG: Unknown protein [uncultured Thiotrichaceae bacterium]|uniref:Uncharacterized protein n=1 Tax=uncultured Thiotrichaceae bacterium TaxID=298394 RepID=A0A6S6UA26_9GAMM|nr:MAG: Unknown protein [uncultured Thiotrichaceae bacterium]